ncbi:hypothetical protein BJ165DRAFT_1407921 [Panaeolus papilionaceus]|nr:hypothetical protein BJ165DRAFT_1407921 [Panaeolus papilionaceus]
MSPMDHIKDQSSLNPASEPPQQALKHTVMLCVVNNINNNAIREIFYDFKKEVLARLTKLEGRIEILELIVHAEMNWLRSCCITDKYLETRFLDDKPQVLRISWLSGQGLHRNEGKYVVWLDNCQRSLTTV